MEFQNFCDQINVPGLTDFEYEQIQDYYQKNDREDRKTWVIEERILAFKVFQVGMIERLKPFGLEPLDPEIWEEFEEGDYLINNWEYWEDFKDELEGKKNER